MRLKGLESRGRGLERGYLDCSHSVNSVGQYQVFIFNSHHSSQGNGERGKKSSGRYLHLKFTLLVGFRTCYHNIYSKIPLGTLVQIFFLLTLLSGTGKIIFKSLF